MGAANAGMVGFLAATATELICGEGLLRTIGL